MSDLAALVSRCTLGPLLVALAASGCGDDATGDRTPAVYGGVDVIDDMEDGDGEIRAVNKRLGTWQAFNDGSAGMQKPGVGEPFTMTDVNPPRTIVGSPTSDSPISRHAVHISGSGFTGWGAGWMVDFNTVGGARQTYDVGKYTGIVFWGRSDAGPTHIKVAFPDLLSDAAGGICDPYDTRVGGKGCYDDFATNITLTHEWRKFEIPFAALATGNWGNRHPFATANVYGIKFSVMPSYASFDSWIDDVAFFVP